MTGVEKLVEGALEELEAGTDPQELRDTLERAISADVAVDNELKAPVVVLYPQPHRCHGD